MERMRACWLNKRYHYYYCGVEQTVLGESALSRYSDLSLKAYSQSVSHRYLYFTLERHVATGNAGAGGAHMHMCADTGQFQVGIPNIPTARTTD